MLIPRFFHGVTIIPSYLQYFMIHYFAFKIQDENSFFSSNNLIS